MDQLHMGYINFGTFFSKGIFAESFWKREYGFGSKPVFLSNDGYLFLTRLP
jgi:hypothetical protein